MRTHARIAIVGGGIAGCSLLQHLVDAGCTDVVLVEKGELTSGSTWHAAGNIPHYMGGRTFSRLHKSSLDFYTGFASRSGCEIGLHRCGSLKVATTKAQLQEYEAFVSIANQLGMPFEVVGPEEVSRQFPYVSTDGVLGAAWTPADGHVDPSSLTQALADSARKAGAKILRHQCVTSIQASANSEWQLETQGINIVAEHVINSAGLHSREVSQLLDHRLPVVPMERQYLVTEPLSGIEDLEQELPVLRDVSAPLYARQEQLSLLLGLYDREPVFWAIEGTPPSFDQELLQPDLDRVGEALRLAMLRIPILNEVGIKRVLNGPLLRTPDAAPLIGPVPSLRNYWLNTGYFAGIAQSGGCTAILARWILEGEPGEDVRVIAASRFDETADADYTMKMTRVAYAQELGQAVVDGSVTAP